MRQGFAHEVFDLLCRYKMVHVWNKSEMRNTFRSFVSRRVSEYWHKRDLDHAKKHDFLLRKFVDTLKPDKFTAIVPLLDPGTNPRIYRAFLKVGLDTRKYVKYCPTCKKNVGVSNLGLRIHQFLYCEQLREHQTCLNQSIGLTQIDDLQALFAKAMVDPVTFQALGKFCMVLDS